MSFVVGNDASYENVKSGPADPKTRNSCPKRKREHPKAKKCSLLPAHAFSPNAKQSRIMQKKGLYAFGKASLRVSRDVYFKQTEESAARVNEDLHKIIDLANCDRKSAKCVENQVKGEATIKSKMASEVETSFKANSGQSRSDVSGTSVRNVVPNNSTKKMRRLCRPDMSLSPSLQLQSSDMCVKASPHPSPKSSVNPNRVLEDTTNDLLATISMRLRDMRPSEDDTNGNPYLGKIRSHLQRIHRQRFHSNVISKLVPNGSSCGTSTTHSVNPQADTVTHNVGDFHPPISPSASLPSCHPVDYRVQIPFTLSRPFSNVNSDHYNVENNRLPVTDFSTKCDCPNNLPRTAPFASCDSPTVKRGQLYPSVPIQSFFSQPPENSAGLDILDYADLAYCNIFPVQDIPNNLSTEHARDDNATWRSLPVVSPIQLSPFFNPMPRFYRRKLY